MVFIPPEHEGYDVGGRVPVCQLDVLFYGGRVSAGGGKHFLKGGGGCVVGAVGG